MTGLPLQGDAIDRHEVSIFRVGATGCEGVAADLRASGSVEPWSVGECHWSSSADECFLVRSETAVRVVRWRAHARRTVAFAYA